MSERRNKGTGEAKTKLGALKELVAKGIVDTVAKKPVPSQHGVCIQLLGDHFSVGSRE